MKKKLIIALIVAVIVLAAAVGAVVYLENKPAADPAVTTTAPTTADNAGTEAATEPVETTEPTEETVIISLPTEDPSDTMPEETFGEENEVPDYTMDPDATEGTEDRESNETPEDVFETGE